MKELEICCDNCGFEIDSTFFVEDGVVLCTDCFTEKELDRIADCIKNDPYGYITDASVYELEDFREEHECP